jgi:hypothetical protein
MRQLEMKCAFVGCSNAFIGPPQQKYCIDPICVEARKSLAQKNRKPKHDDDANNLSITKGKFQNGTILNIQCAAHGLSGRCTKTFLVAYDPSRLIYPKYCEHHRNAFQRARFEGTIKNA